MFGLSITKETLKKTGQFLLYTASIYACYICTGIYHEKILKHYYPNNTNDQKQQFQGPIVFTIFPQFVCMLIGWSIRLVMSKVYEEKPVSIPGKKAAWCSLVINCNMLTYNKAIQAASFPAVVMVKSCSMLSVILVALFCSRVKDKSLKLPLSKLWVGLAVSLGIILFNYFKNVQNSNNQPISYWSSLLLLISLLGDGVLPDLQAEIKAEYKPGVIDMYYEINKYTWMVGALYATCTWQLPYILNYALTHPEWVSDMVIFSVLSAIGQLVIYRMIKLFKQHIVPFVIATRKCLTVVVNILYFGHSVNEKQLAGMMLVFAAIMLEVVLNAREKQQKEEEGKELPPIDIQNFEKKALRQEDEEERSSQKTKDIECDEAERK